VLGLNFDIQATSGSSALFLVATPRNISDIRSWYGLINQVAYSFVKTEHMAPIRHLLSPAKPFEWTKELEEAFEKSKKKIAE
jgi:hypothetical protein